MTLRQRATLLVFILASPAIMPNSVLAAEGSAQRAVLVTGASTGIGRNIAETLAANGHFVYAGARKATDIAELTAIENIQGVRLDVTIQEEIDAAVRLVEKGGRGLHGVVNNAGVNVIGPLVEIEESELDFLFDVNVYGPYRITKSFAPMIIASKGRIVNISSISGTLSGPLYGIYSMSKHALEAYTDTLEWEMESLGVKVIAVEPGNYKSKIRRTGASRDLEQVKAAGGEVTEEMKMAYEATAARELSYKEPDEVSEAFLHALFDDAPLRRYMVVPNEGEQAMTIQAKLNELVQLNQWGPYSYSRDELVELLDGALSGDAATE